MRQSWQSWKLRAVLPILATVFTLVAYSKGPEQKKKETLEPGEQILWTDPGDPSKLDFQYGVGGSENQPQPPFRFVNEDSVGTTAKINVIDSRGVAWNVKWGDEASPSTFCTRLLWACGYYARPEYFLPAGRIDGAKGLKRAKAHVSDDGSFVNARFQLRTDSPTFLKDQGWTWTRNPFVGTHELQGLKVLMLLVSNWDAKDARDTVTGPYGEVMMDSNLGIFADDSTGARRYLYSNDDWGSSMGKWGGYFERSKWNCKGFAKETREFVKLENGSLEWGYGGKHQKDLIADISAADVEWLLQYLGRITDDQIRSGLDASGATPAQSECFTAALRQRIEQLQSVASGIEAKQVK